MALTDIDTIVIVIMENRSFDHMLGYLSLSGTSGGTAAEGLRADPGWRAAFANRYGGQAYQVHRLDPAVQWIDDPQHDQTSIGMQISSPPAGPGPNSMGGFVQSYMQYSSPTPAHPSAVMGYYDQAALPTFDFFAKHYCVCDHWFASLPLGTQANRLMAMAGESLLLDNAGALLPEQRLVYDWLNDNKINWCAYQSGDFLPFFSLMASWLPEIVSSLTLSSMGVRGHFRRYDQLRSEWLAADPVPSVIFIEPEYTDGPHGNANDDHSPTGVAPGQAFLADLYNTLTSNQTRWAKTMLLITYDEHGGFFDHVPPLAIATTITGQPVQTTGVRVPAFVISPFAQPGSAFEGPLDHTSILQLLDDRFGGGPGYSVAVNQRQMHFDRLLNAVVGGAKAKSPPALTLPALAAAPTAPTHPVAPNTANAQALHAAAQKFADEHPDLVRHPTWGPLRDYLANANAP